MAEFVKGLYIDVKETQYGQIFKLSIKEDEFMENITFKDGRSNIDCLKSKNNNWYAKYNDFVPSDDYKKGGDNQQKNSNEKQGYDDGLDDDLPF